MATYVQTNIGLYWGSYSLASTFNAVGLSMSNNLQDDTTYGDTFTSNASGLSSVSLEGEGYWDSTNDGILQTSTAISAAEALVTVTPVDQAVGSPALFTQLKTSEYNPIATGTVGEMMAFRVTGEGQGEKVIHGEIMVAPGTTRTAGATTAYNHLGAVSATQAIYSALHVLTVGGSGGTLDVVVQSSASSGGTYNTEITHTQATAITSELKSNAGANTDAYWRVVYTINTDTGRSFDFICSIGII
jgi:hypothetical protein